MRAQVQRGYGGGDAVGIETIPDPVAGPGEVVVAVKACALNRLDLLQQAAPLVRGFSLPHVAGMDVAGIVVARSGELSADVGPAIGDHVIVDPVSTCGVCERCTSGFSPYCENLRTIGSTRPGGFAEFVAVPASHTYHVPQGMSFVEAATLPVAAMTAFHAIEAGRFADGETVLVNGAGSGVSCALLALLAARGATVLTTAGGPGKVAQAIDVGYHHAIDYRSENVADAVRSLTNGRGVPLVIDHVGPALFQQSIDSMALEGRMVFCGTTTGTEALLSLTSVYHWGRSLIGAGGYLPADFPRMLEAMATAGVAPVVDSVWPLAALADAQRKMADGDFFGKIVIEF